MTTIAQDFGMKGNIELVSRPELMWTLVFYCLVSFGCSPDDPEPRQILGHSVATKGVFHGEPKEFAGRYCETCHGLNLAGGVEFQPSCYQCHGKTWKLVPPNVSRAPADHVVDFGGFRHHPQYKNPTGYCNACHGFKLEGGLIQRTPSCLLCHDKKW